MSPAYSTRAHTHATFACSYVVTLFFALLGLMVLILGEPCPRMQGPSDFQNFPGRLKRFHSACEPILLWTQLLSAVEGGMLDILFKRNQAFVDNACKSDLVTFKYFEGT